MSIIETAWGCGCKGWGSVMGNNIFLEDDGDKSLELYMEDVKIGRGNLGDEIPVAVYRLLEYSLREELGERFGREEQIDIFRRAGYRASAYFADHMLDLSLPKNEFLAQLQVKMEVLKIGILRVEEMNEETGRVVINMAEDADCSGLPTLGETVCNYDEGFLSGVLSTYTGTEYEVVEVDCWATGSRVCRFHANVRK